MTVEKYKETINLAARFHGKKVNYSEWGEILGISSKTVKIRLQHLEKMGIVKLLPRWPAGVIRIYLRNPVGYQKLLYLIRAEVREKSESGIGCIIDMIIRFEEKLYSNTRFYYYESTSGYRIDLIIERNNFRIGLLLCAKSFVRRRYCRILQYAANRDMIHRGFVLYSGRGGFFVSARIIAVPHRIFVPSYTDWTREANSQRDYILLLRWLNNLDLISDFGFVGRSH